MDNNAHTPNFCIRSFEKRDVGCVTLIDSAHLCFADRFGPQLNLGKRLVGASTIQPLLNRRPSCLTTLLNVLGVTRVRLGAQHHLYVGLRGLG